MDDLRYLIEDGLHEPDCPFCEEPGGTVPFGSKLLHPHCYGQLGRELDVSCQHNTMVEHDEPGFAWRCADCGYVYGKENSVNKTYGNVIVHVRTDDADVAGYPIEDKQGNVLGHSPTTESSDIRTAIAAALGIPEDQIRYYSDSEDDNGPIEVWEGAGVVLAAR
jgi:hypothetical protein